MTKIGYIRVSTDEQNLERQRENLEAVGVKEFFEDKLSGKDVNRPQLQEMLNFIRKDDIVVVAELDRLGRNNKEITEIINKINEKGATLEIQNLPSLSGIQDDNLRRLLNNLILELFKYTAENERKQLLDRQKQGIELAKKEGKYKGRPVKYHKDATGADKLVYDGIVNGLKEGVPVKKIANNLGISRNTVYKIKKIMI
ncbi:recombinase family protein [Vagococcus vulneris]|uniref:Resolvase/invertase-type recombinase catalytic domain-containing protein n=1 Tax=Vagococcus vulneris TaxID=1977869 RepID=A0A430A1E9_9ENTE|nr:recombinase family protein [Vagococcus vulneris]RSU00235.1 hypothetical protein CBF37_02760 [Vagococcus vulneris]